MNVIARRKIARRALKSIVSNSGQVLVIHYSQKGVENKEEISLMITSIVVRSLDNNINETFGIHLEADLLGYTIYDIEDLYPDLELSMLKKFNDFVRNHLNYTWIHWDMSTQDFGFPAIKHRFLKLAGQRAVADFREIPVNKKVNLHDVFNNIYGENFIEGSDKIQELIKINNNSIIPGDYLMDFQESNEFYNGNFRSIINSLRCKTDYFCSFINKLINKTIKVRNKNMYAIFIDFITHPLFNLIGWIATILGLALAIYLWVK